MISKEQIGPDLMFVIFYTTAFWGQEIYTWKSSFFAFQLEIIALG